MPDIVAGPAARAPVGRCSVAECAHSGSRKPVLRIALAGSEHVSWITLPVRVCSKHMAGFGQRFLTPARRGTIEASLRSRGRAAPDWSRTDIVFE